MTPLLKSGECRKQARLMGSAFEFVIADERDDTEVLMTEAINEVKRIESLLTEFSETSQTSQLNRSAGAHPVQVDPEVYAILKRSKEISHLTQGAFDITSGSLKKLYNFKGEHVVFPVTAQLQEALKKTGYSKISLLNDYHVQLTTGGMHIGFGAIGKGYAADKVKALWIRNGVRNGVINASGDLTAWGARADGSSWRVGIADPNEPSRIMAWVPVSNASVATSGNYEQYFEKDGRRYSHNIDPKSGHPVTGIKSVTIVSPSAELSDALATAVTVMGVKVGLHFIEQLPHTHCLITDDNNKIFTSRHLKMNVNKEA